MSDHHTICNCGSELDGSHDHTTCGPPITEVTCDRCGKLTVFWYEKNGMDLCAVCAPKVVREIVKARQAK